MSTGAAIVGAAECDLGVTDKSILTLQSQAVTRALADAGLGLADVDGIATNGISRFSATHLADYLGVVPTWTDSTFAGGSAFEMYVARAGQAIAAGQASVVVISFASNQRSARTRKMGGVHEAWVPEAQFEEPYDLLYPLSYYAMAAQAYLHRYGGTREQLAEVAVAAREWALLNPRAFRHGKGPLSVEEVLSSPVISSPLTAADCCLVTDGGGAVVLTSLERARDLPGTPVEVLGYGERTTNTSFTAVADLSVPGAAGAAGDAYARAGITPADVEVAQVYDSFTITAALSLEALGFCGPGEALDLISDGRTRPGGALPLNTNGGGLSYCHPGQYGVLLLVEAVRQLRGECGDRQVPGAEVAVAHGTGGILSTHATVVLSSPMSADLPSGWTPGEVPPADEVSAAYWAATGEHRLTVQVCGSCDHLQHPPRALCTGCGSMDHLAQVDACGGGTVDTFTVVHRPPRPGVTAPYTVARVRLVEGPVVLTRLEPSEGWSIGDRVAVAFHDLPDGRALPYFLPVPIDHPEES